MGLGIDVELYRGCSGRRRCSIGGCSRFLKYFRGWSVEEGSGEGRGCLVDVRVERGREVW